MPKRLLITSLIILTLLAGTGLFAQSNQLVDEVIAQKPIQFGHAAYLILTASEKIPETASTEEAAAFALAQKWGLQPQSASAPAPLGQVSLLIMKSLDLKGGLFYSLFPGTRYALRELSYLKVAAKPNWPEKLLAGDEVMRMLTKAMEIKEKQ